MYVVIQYIHVFNCCFHVGINDTVVNCNLTERGAVGCELWWGPTPRKLCPLGLALCHLRTYGRDGHNGPYCHQLCGGHCALLVEMTDAAVVTVEAPLKRGDGRMQDEWCENHCAHTHTSTRKHDVRCACKQETKTIHTLMNTWTLIHTHAGMSVCYSECIKAYIHVCAQAHLTHTQINESACLHYTMFTLTLTNINWIQIMLMCLTCYFAMLNQEHSSPILLKHSWGCHLQT